MEVGAAESSIELIWGIGVVNWQKDGKVLDRPLLERRVEIELDDAHSGLIRIRPTRADPLFDLKPYEELGCSNLASSPISSGVRYSAQPKTRASHPLRGIASNPSCLRRAHASTPTHVMHQRLARPHRLRRTQDDEQSRTGRCFLRVRAHNTSSSKTLIACADPLKMKKPRLVDCLNAS